MKKGLCGQADLDKCLEEFEDLIEWNCKNCPKKRAEDLSDWTRHLLRLRRLQLGGYPFAANDLDLDVWMDLGKVNECLQMPVF